MWLSTIQTTRAASSPIHVWTQHAIRPRRHGHELARRRRSHHVASAWAPYTPSFLSHAAYTLACLYVDDRLDLDSYRSTIWTLEIL